MEIIRIKSTHKASQGDFVEINEEDFNPETMSLYVEGEAPKTTVEEKPAKKRKG